MPPQHQPGPNALHDAWDRARLVTIEGIDGAGKSTVIPLVEAGLQERGLDAHFTREETTTAMGDAVRAAVRDHADPLAVLYLFLADRVQHLVELAGPLGSGRLVVSDRYHDSTRAYQGVALQDRFADMDEFEAYLAVLSRDWLIPPTRTYLLDIDPAMAMKRLASREVNAAYEKLDFLRQVRARYLELAEAEPGRWLVLDATKSPPALAQAVIEDIEKHVLKAPKVQ